ncbi:MAG: adenosylhomocysteinase [Pseudomonadota bacterium]
MLSDADFVITATGGMRAIAEPEFAHLPHDVILANAGHRNLEIDIEALAELADAETAPLRDVHRFMLGGRDTHVLSRGALIDIAGGSGHPVEIMDLTFAVQGIGAPHLINADLEPGVHVLPKSLDDSIAAAKLKSLGINLTEGRKEQADNLIDWVEKISL